MNTIYKPFNLAKSLVIMCAIFTFLLSGISNATPIPSTMSNQDINTLVALEATQNSLVVIALGLEVPIQAQSLGSWTGIIDPSGWSLEFLGNLNGMPLSIAQSGTRRN